MDQDDRQDGNTQQDEQITPPPENNEIEPSQPKFQVNSENDSPETMTHTAPEIDAPSESADLEPAEVNAAKTLAIGSEIEPTTVAYQPGSTAADPAPPEQSPVTEPVSGLGAEMAASTTAAAVAVPAEDAKGKKKLLIMIAAGVALLVIIGLAAWWVLRPNSTAPSDQSSNTLSTPIDQPKLGIAVTIADGTVEYSIDAATWQAATAETQLEEGNSIRTGAESRAVLTLDDGSAVRLDADTEVKLTSLAADNVNIEQVRGSVYSRIVPSDRTYIVAIEDTTYEALGTAFVTIKKESESGVQVYQSTVKTSDSDEAVTEGKQYYNKNTDGSIQGKLTDINIDALVDNAFVNWNLSQDQSDTNFKEKLGVLSQIKARADAREGERKAAVEQAAKDEAARILREKEEAKKKAEHQSHDNNGVTRGTMTLGLSGKTFGWNYTGKAIHGYKLVYSKKTETPTFGTNDAIYYSDANMTEGELPSKHKIGSGKYYVRVCAYTASSEGDKCVDYSNVVIINI